MKKHNLSWSDVHQHVTEILRQMQIDNWRPDYVVGITRGGLVPATMISQYLDCPMNTLKVSLRDSNPESESNLWMSEDAYGYDNPQKNLLIVDDINDSGATLNWIRQDWQAGCLPNDPTWETVWGNNVRVAVLLDNETSNSNVPVSYSGQHINKSVDPSWVVFPWEAWWKL